MHEPAAMADGFQSLCYPSAPASGNVEGRMHGWEERYQDCLTAPPSELKMQCLQKETVISAGGGETDLG